jgi:hypothetical protein
VSTQTIIILGAIVVAIVAGMFSRIAGRTVGFLLVLGLIGWGAHVYGEGRSLAFFGHPLSPVAFYGILGALAAYEAATLVLAVRARRRAMRPVCPVCGSVEVEESAGQRTCRSCHHRWI